VFGTDVQHDLDQQSGGTDSLLVTTEDHTEMQDLKERPMNRDAISYVDYVDDATWQPLVGALLDSDRVEILSRHSQVIFVGIGAGTRLYRVAGTAADGGRRPVEWSMVVKVLTLDQLSFQSISTDQSSWDYWKREWHAYQSAWLQQLPGPLVAPRCLATGEIAETDHELAWIAMEDLRALDHRPWPAGQFREVARHLGIFNADYLSGRPLPTDPWLSRDWLRGWTELAEPQIALLPTVSSHPVAGRIFTPDIVDDLIELWDQREKLYEALDQLPQTLCHNDVFPRNLFIRGNGHPTQSVAIDWACCGEGPVGQELACLVGATQAFFESRPERWDDLERDCLDGYAEGLRQAGWKGSDEILLGYLLSIVLHFGIGALSPVLGVTLTVEHHDLVERLFGRSYDECIANGVAAFQFQQRRIHQARDLLGI
jgi:Phosphotransferase enzyme family